MNLGIKSKVALVTASSKGLGKAAAKALAAEGVKVIICSRNKEKKWLQNTFPIREEYIDIVIKR